jgi:hypothetical protein
MYYHLVTGVEFHHSNCCGCPEIWCFALVPSGLSFFISQTKAKVALPLKTQSVRLGWQGTKIFLRWQTLGGVIEPLKRFLHLKMLNSAPKWHKLMSEIPNVRFSCGNSNIRDLLQILATEIQTNFNNSSWHYVSKLCWNAKKNMSPK